MSGPSPAFRFAPSPNGELHLGHALSALTTWQWAERYGGRFLLRIEDIDTGRARPEFVAQIFDDLAWLGLRWPEPVLHQSEHFEIYRGYAARLTEMGLLYPCFATRAEIKAAVAQLSDPAFDPDGAPVYPGLHKGMPEREVAERQESGQPYALRLDMARAIDVAMQLSNGQPLAYRALDENDQARDVLARPERWGDAVVVRKDVPASYHLAVVVDDARQGISHVTRGQDLEAATCLHRLLQVLLDLRAPVYHHHRLLLDDHGRKLAKSAGSTSIRSLREAGASPGEVIAMAQAR